MKNILLLAACIMSLSFISACNEQGVDYDTSLPMAQPNVADTANTNATGQQMAPSVSVPSNAAQNNPALNPEHGQPGHRCDIAVGAPLNSPAPQAQPTVGPAQPATNILTNTNTSGVVTLNPPHGQPGHDCAIPVGQPLKS
jgi:hypothetical protein